MRINKAVLAAFFLLALGSGGKSQSMTLNNGLITGTMASTSVPVPATPALFVGTDGVFVAAGGKWVALGGTQAAGVQKVNGKSPDATGNVTLAATTSLQ
jgi:hypothetical protein